VIAKVRERLAVSKRMVKKMDVERFNLKHLNGKEVKEKYQVTIKNRFSTLVNLDDNGEVNRAWETIRDNKNFGQREYRVL
jgi:predicted 3-demethylubiquinone-9 3-methyltransferase (glyoxalase superfamily)